jgi:sigma-B regulation protein RsbU (phosphoserine phosphatase)
MTDRIKRQAQEIEMQYASQIQRKLYPVEAPRIRGYDIAGAAFPMDEVCGDYFDYLPLPNDGLGLVIGDVCGHGLGPALIMTATRSYLRFLSNRCSDLGKIFETMNDALFADLERNRFVALMLARIDIPSRHLVYANAGHTPGYHLDPRGAVKAVLGSTGLPLGMFPNGRYECSGSVALEPGDLVVLLTDGISEAEDGTGNFFGTENALNVIRAHSHEPAEQIVEHLYRAARDFAGEALPQDDITVVVCKVGSTV